MPGIFSKISDFINLAFKKQISWKEIEYFDEDWKKRVEKMSDYLIPGKSVMDLGCGKMYLRNFLKNNYYIPVDYTKRDDDTIICDFNKKEFPDINADICFISGCLEYIEEYSWFINKVCNNSNRVILSYCTTDEFPDLVLRKSYSWVNHLSEQTIRLLFDKNSFGLIKTDKSHNKDQIFIFEKS